MTINSRPQRRLSITTRPDGKLTIKGLAVWSKIEGVRGYNSPEEGDNFTVEDLDAMINAQNEIGGILRPRLYPSHPVSPMLKLLARPQGEITNLQRDGEMLLADLDGVNPDFWKKAQADGARLSPDVKLGHRDPLSGKTYPLSIVGVGVLGAAPPANQIIPALDEYSAVYYADAAQQRAYGDGEVKAYTGMPLPKADPAPSPLSRAAEHLRAYTAQPEAPQPVSPERQPGFSQVLISRKES